MRSIKWLVFIIWAGSEGRIMAHDVDPLPEGDRSRFVRDVTIPDGTKVKPGATLNKEWEIENVGTVEWKDRFLTPISSSAGEADLKSITPTPISATAPGQKVRVKATLRAPQKKGSYRVEFKMADKTGRQLLPNQKPLFILVEVE